MKRRVFIITLSQIKGSAESKIRIIFYTNRHNDVSITTSNENDIVVKKKSSYTAINDRISHATFVIVKNNLAQRNTWLFGRPQNNLICKTMSTVLRETNNEMFFIISGHGSNEAAMGPPSFTYINYCGRCVFLEFPDVLTI